MTGSRWLSSIYVGPDAVAEFVKYRLPVRKVASSISDQAKAMFGPSWYLSIPNLVLDITRIGQGPASSVPG